MPKLIKPRKHARVPVEETSARDRDTRTVHEKRRDHACTHCAAAFARGCDLARHVRAVHEKCKNHACPHCASVFSEAGHLSRHVQTVHDQVRDHACPHCAAAFGTSSHLARHVRAVHEKRRDHACPHCTAAFGTASKPVPGPETASNDQTSISVLAQSSTETPPDSLLDKL